MTQKRTIAEKRSVAIKIARGRNYGHALAR
jgi:hypothetical protein